MCPPTPTHRVEGEGDEVGEAGGGAGSQHLDGEAGPGGGRGGGRGGAPDHGLGSPLDWGERPDWRRGDRSGHCGVIQKYIFSSLVSQVTTSHQTELNTVW